MNSARAESSFQRFFFPALALLVCLLSLFVFFRHFFLSRGNLITGAIGDNRMNIVILEHWNAVIRGKASFTSPDFYWPQRDVLGYSDAEFLLAVPYVALRFIDIDPYRGFEVSLMVLKAIGFFSMLWLLRSFVRTPKQVALLGAALFTIGNSYYLQAVHCQLVSVVFSPLLVCLILHGWKWNKVKRVRALLLAGSAGLLLALLFFTSYYIGWFTVFALVLFLLVSVGLQLIEARSWLPLRDLGQRVRSSSGFISVGACAFCAAMIPFLMVYLPALHETGGRTFADVLAWCANPIDFVNVGPRNLLWGHPLNKYLTRYAHHPLQVDESAIGWPLITLALIVAGFYFGFREPPGKKHLMAALLAAFVIGCALTLRVHDGSLWYAVFVGVPGASAIRAVERFNLVLTIFGIVIIALVLAQVLKRSRILFYVLAALLLVEQVNTTVGERMMRQKEFAIFARVTPAPPECRSFFLAHPVTPARPYFANQIDAMLVARAENLPTLNGYSGWAPKQWDLNDLNDVDYLANVRRWAISRNVAAGLCGLDLRYGSWSRVDFKNAVYTLGSQIDFKHGGNAFLFETDGWSSQEPGGSWMLGAHSGLVLNLASVPASNLVLSLTANPFIVLSRPRVEVTVRANGHDIAEWTILTPHVNEHAIIPRELTLTGQLRIEFIDHDPKSPAEVGYSADNRKLGLSVEEMNIAESRR